MDVRGASLVYEELKVHSHIAYHHVSDSSHCNLIFTKIYSMADEGIKINTSITYKFGFFLLSQNIKLEEMKNIYIEPNLVDIYCNHVIDNFT